MCWRPICGPLLIIFWLPLCTRVVYAVDAFLALAFAEGTFDTIALAIAFASASISGLAVALPSIFSFALARLLVVASAFARAMGCAVPFACTIRATLGAKLATHPGWCRA